MNTRILFVDDDTFVLQGIRRMLHDMRREWEMEFVESGSAALALLDKKPCDIIVTDMRMPGMNGVELLTQVMEHFPQTARLILSGHADQELVMRSVGATHQYLTKPCDADALKSTIRRTSRIQNSICCGVLRGLIGKMHHLPSVPSVFLRIMNALKEDEEVEMRELARIIASDMAMSAQILRIVNSAYFGIARQVSSVEEAVNYLGVETLKSLVLSIHVFSEQKPTQVSGYCHETQWRHSMDTAHAAKAIARFEKANFNLVEEAYCAGLLHDVGKLILACNFGETYSRAMELARREGVSLVEAEIQEFGANHADVGGYFMGLWGLPVPIVEAICLHHSPAQSQESGFNPLIAVHAANALGPKGSSPGQPNAELDLEFLEQLGLADRGNDWRAVVTEAHLNSPAL